MDQGGGCVGRSAGKQTSARLRPLPRLLILRLSA
jgi:hypothetical protein